MNRSLRSRALPGALAVLLAVLATPWLWSLADARTGWPCPDTLEGPPDMEVYDVEGCGRLLLQTGASTVSAVVVVGLSIVLTARASGRSLRRDGGGPRPAVVLVLATAVAGLVATVAVQLAGPKSGAPTEPVPLLAASWAPTVVWCVATVHWSLRRLPPLRVP